MTGYVPGLVGDVIVTRNSNDWLFGKIKLPKDQLIDEELPCFKWVNNNVYKTMITDLKFISIFKIYEVFKNSIFKYIVKNK